MNHDKPASNFRWIVVVLLFFAITINYIDRAVLGVLKPMLDGSLGWTQKEYGWMVTAFQAAYALGYVFSGRLLDRFGVRTTFMWLVVVWSLASVVHAAATSVLEFSLARAALGLAEGGALPAAVKAVTEWFPRERRAFATGVFNAGSQVGAILCPVLIPWIAGHWGWQGAFVITGLVGLIWVIPWWWSYQSPERHPRISPSELAYIRKEPEEKQTPMPWLQLLQQKQTWAFVAGMVASSPIWWFYIYWVPDFLHKHFGLDLKQSSLPLAVIFLCASFGGIGGGWFSSALLRKGWSTNAARKTALLICSIAILPVFLTPLLPVSQVWIAVSLVALAAAAHCGYAANLFTLVSDTVPRQAVGSVVGIGGMAGSIAGMVFAQFVSRVLDATQDNYVAPFAIAASVYLIALAIIQLLLPTLQPMRQP